MGGAAARAGGRNAEGIRVQRAQAAAAAHSSFAASPPAAAFSNHIASMRTGADTRLMPTLVAMGALYDSAVAASESIGKLCLGLRAFSDARRIERISR